MSRTSAKPSVRGSKVIRTTSAWPVPWARRSAAAHQSRPAPYDRPNRVLMYSFALSGGSFTVPGPLRT
jgi:hypothetical protein